VDELQKAVLATGIALLFCLFTNGQGLVFDSYTVESGTAGANNCVYRFKNVSTGVDALVKIKKRSASNIVLLDIDVDDFGWKKAFQPQIGPRDGLVSGNTSWWMDFEINFVKAATTESVSVSSFDITALDVDGDGQYIREYIEMYKADAYLIETVSLLQIANLKGNVYDDDDNGNGKRFVGPVTNFLNIDTAGTKVMATTKYKNKNKISIRIGATKTGSALSDAGYRYNSIWFKTFNYIAARFLPVKLTAFTAHLEKKKVLLQWTTATETNTSHFVIERGTDGVHFSDAGILFTEGNSVVARSYQFADINIGAPLVYYRLRVVDLDGKYNYSSVRMIRTLTVGKEALVVVFPNPVVKELRVTIPANWQGSKVHYQVMRQDGLVVRRWSVSGASQTEVTDFSSLPAGNYFITVQRDEETLIQKVIKK
jgi:hypothetical protein